MYESLTLLTKSTQQRQEPGYQEEQADGGGPYMDDLSMRMRIHITSAPSPRGPRILPYSSHRDCIKQQMQADGNRT